jgi:hypothetical protein
MHVHTCKRGQIVSRVVDVMESSMMLACDLARRRVCPEGRRDSSKCLGDALADDGRSQAEGNSGNVPTIAAGYCHRSPINRCTATSTGRVVMRSKAGETLQTRLAQGEAIAWGSCMRLAKYSVRHSSRDIRTLQGGVGVGMRIQAEG